MTESYKIEFYKFLNGDYSVKVFEELIYSLDSWEDQLEKDSYLELITFDYKNPNAQDRLSEFIFKSIISKADFLKWKIKEMLINFIEHPEKTKSLLDEFYIWTNDAYNSQGEVVKGFGFLQDLGMNFLFWMDREYLEAHYGKKWQIEYMKYKNELGFYHEQLKPIATKILKAINNDEIKIKGQGNYEITESLKKELESDQIFRLKTFITI